MKEIQEIIAEILGTVSSDWSTEFKNYPSINANFISSNTQGSVNMVDEVTKLLSGLYYGNVATDGTNIHSQQSTNFCHSFGIMSGLRNELIKITKDKTSNEVVLASGKDPTEIKGGKTGKEVLTDQSPDNRYWKNICSFKKMLAGFINNVNPRSFEGLDGDTIRQSKISKQTAILSKVVDRLVSKSMFETEGWKRIYGVFRFFEAFNLDIENFELEAVKVSHPMSVGNRHFQKKILFDKVETSMDKPFCEVHSKTFIVRH